MSSISKYKIIIIVLKEEIKDEEKWIIIRRLYKTTHGSTHSGSTVVSLIYKNHFLKKKKKLKLKRI